MPNIEVPTPDGFFDSLFADRSAPEGFYTTAQLCERYGLKRSAMNSRLAQLVKEGKLARSEYRTGDSQKPIPHYGPPG